jgi:hypothetical protein
MRILFLFLNFSFLLIGCTVLGLLKSLDWVPLPRQLCHPAEIAETCSDSNCCRLGGFLQKTATFKTTPQN